MNWFAHMLFGGAVTILPAAVYAQTQTTTTQSLSFFPLPSALPAPLHDLLGRPFVVSAERRGTHLVLDLGPALDEILGFLHAHGIPLREDPALAGKRGVVFSASWQVGEDNDPIRFRIGDRGPLDAFYANEGGFRAALTVPLPGLRRFAFHLEGGEDSEFGN